MSNDIFVLVEHRNGQVSEGTYELIGKARSLAASTGGQAVALVLGQELAPVTATLGAAQKVIAVEGESVANFTPAGYVSALQPVLEERAPVLTLFPNTAVGMDVAAGLSAKLGLPLAAYAAGIDVAGTTVAVVSQAYGGKMNAELEMTGGRGLVTVLAGAFSAEEGKADGAPEVETVAAAGDSGGVEFRRLIEPEAGDVDITKEEILISVGRGIEEQDNIELAQELADALGGAVSASRPVVDAGWLPKSRQVGKSGLSVKPKLYIAVGISGAPEHLEGMRDSTLIVAVNSDASAPIFGAAHYGVVGDLFDFLPALTEKVEEA